VNELSDHEKSMLGFLYGGEPQPIKKIATAMNVTVEHALMTLKRLIRLGLAQRSFTHHTTAYFRATRDGRMAAI